MCVAEIFAVAGGDMWIRRSKHVQGIVRQGRLSNGEREVKVALLEMTPTTAVV